MIKLIDTEWFESVDSFKENDDGTVQWYKGNENGFIKSDMVLSYTDSNNEEQTINVWSKLWQLHNDTNSTVTVLDQDLAPVIEAAKQQINTERDNLISAGIDFDVNSVTHTFQTDNQSIMDIMGAILAGTSVTWLTLDNTPVQMTNTEIISLGQAVAAHKASLVYQARTHKDNIEACTSVSQVQTYMSSLSWS